MLEGIEHPRHLDELDRPVEVAGEPELLEMGDVPHIPEDRAHEHVVLHPELVVGQRRDQMEGPRARLGQPLGDDVPVDTTRSQSRTHAPSSLVKRLVSDSASVGCAKTASLRLNYGGFFIVASCTITMISPPSIPKLTPPSNLPL